MLVYRSVTLNFQNRWFWMKSLCSWGTSLYSWEAAPLHGQQVHLHRLPWEAKVDKKGYTPWRFPTPPTGFAGKHIHDSILSKTIPKKTAGSLCNSPPNKNMIFLLRKKQCSMFRNKNAQILTKYIINNISSNVHGEKNNKNKSLSSNLPTHQKNTKQKVQFWLGKKFSNISAVPRFQVWIPSSTASRTTAWLLKTRGSKPIRLEEVQPPFLVGGWTNPSEKYESNWKSSPNRGEN